MGPVSAFAFSVCGWVRFEGAVGWAGVAGAATGQGAGAGCMVHSQGSSRAATSTGRAGMDKGSTGKSQGTPPTYGHNSRAGAAWQAWAWATLPGRQGSRGAGGGSHKECPAPCSGPAAPTPHPWVCAWACSRAQVLLPCSWVWPAGPWVRGDGGGGGAGEPGGDWGRGRSTPGRGDRAGAAAGLLVHHRDRWWTATRAQARDAPSTLSQCLPISVYL